ncbi:MAG TPA: DUF429 domain-containing protein [Candidatus Altiarchaeales archaeon]|nr:DUF429 domain-containing protein [Candidatus Altiarchaeales archaeon]
MRIIGLDLAGKPSNPTGFCILESDGGCKKVSTSIAYSDDEILEKIFSIQPDLVAVDAPLKYAGVNRLCDEELSRYGALPATLSGMSVLAARGTNLAKKLADAGLKCIEVHSKSSAKILGVYAKDDFDFQKNIMALDVDGGIANRLYSRDELDAVVAAITGYLHLEGATREVGDSAGVIQVPSV